MADESEEEAETLAEEQPEVVPSLASVDPECVEWVKSNVDLPGVRKTDLKWEPEHEETIAEFIASTAHRRLFAWSDPKHGLSLSTAAPQSEHEHLQYFLKPETVLTSENIAQVVQFGTVQGAPVYALLRLMTSVYVPRCLGDTSWPETIKKEFTSQMHRFMASLTECAWDQRGTTRLYIPSEEGLDTPEVAAKQKELVQRLESTLIHWTRQIKEVVNRQEEGGDADDAGPLAEVQFWSSRTVDLSGIHAQLEREGVKRIVAVLELAKSSYLAPFEKLAVSILEGTIEAVDNLKFLENLNEPCGKLAEAEPMEIPAMLPPILNVVRLIWRYSKFYNTPDRLAGLLRKVSNEIISRCRASISIGEILDGDVSLSMAALSQSISAVQAWFKMYDSTEAAVRARGEKERTGRKWSLDRSSIFAQIDAFVQRCHDLQEVCEGQKQFARRGPGGVTADLPVFGGAHGSEVATQILQIQTSYEKEISRLRSLDYDILDVKSTYWHDDFSAYKNSVKDLEVMFQNVINTAFEGAPTTQAGVELLDAFTTLSYRDAIKRCVEKKSAEVFQSVTAELSLVKKGFDRHRGAPPMLHRDHPKYAGAAVWARSLLLRIQRQWAMLENSAKTKEDMAKKTPEANQAMEAYAALENSLDEFIRRMFSEWITSIDSGISRFLETFLMQRSTTMELVGKTGRERYGYVEQAFDKSLLHLSSEVHHWEKLRFEVPYSAMEVASGPPRERYRCLREKVLALVRGYNEILSQLTPQERRLFSERLVFLDRKIGPGLSKLTWNAKAQLDVYLKETKRHCADASKLVSAFHGNKALLAKSCRQIASSPLVSLRKKHVYPQELFISEQSAHQGSVKGKLQDVHKQMKALMRSTHEIFKSDSDEVSREWNNFVESIDRGVEEALRQTAKRSLLELSRSINGDAKTEVQALFRISVVLQTSKVEFKPSIAELTQTVNTVSRDAIATTSAMPRLVDALRDDPDAESKHPSFYANISNDEDVLRVLVQVMTGMRDILPKLQKYLNTWDRYKHIWDVDKDAFMRRYAKANRALTAFETDITRYKELQHEIGAEEGISNIGFIRIDSQPLKEALRQHCGMWQLKFTQLLNSQAATELQELLDHMENCRSKLAQKPKNLDMLADMIKLHETEVQSQKTTEDRFEPLETQYRLLEKFEVTIKESELAKLAGLRTEWATHKTMLQETGFKLQKSKNDFKDELIATLASFNNQIIDQRNEFLRNAPFTAEVSVEEALALIAQYRESVKMIRTKENDMKAGLGIFAIDPPVNAETASTEVELDLLDQVWSMMANWTKNMDQWKTGKFASMNVPEIETVAADFGKQITKLAKEFKGGTGGNWKVLGSLKDRVENIKKLMPLIMDLRNEAMRPRHWNQLMEDVGKEFDPYADTFTLNLILELGLEHYADTISALSGGAAKELAIEEALVKIEKLWGELTLDLAPYKEYIKLRSVDDVYAALEDNAVLLSTMKASRFAIAFLEALDKWEKALSHVSETIEMMMNVQRKWMYLESIFVGSEDIRRQLPTESSLFDQVNADWISTTARMEAVKIAYKATHLDGVLELLTKMDETLDRIQKSLDEYLETKRQAFPRFYFLSNDDLLEILGQARDPQAVQPHVRKCFEAIKILDMKDVGKGGRQIFEAHGFKSPESEYVKLEDNLRVTCGGPVEAWLLQIETSMCTQLAKDLYKSWVDIKKSKREKWISTWAGQLSICTGQIVWTTECTKALMTMSEGGGKAPMKSVKKKQVSALNKLCDMVRGNLGKLDRKKVVNIITVEVHSRDVIDRMVKSGCSSVNDFEWLLQLRFYWEEGSQRCVVKQTNTSTLYGYEYLGNPARLVVTPLTDRCYTTLTTALHLHRGGLPQGPAGTGKTETVKDLSKNLAKQCIVFNCSDGLDYKSLGRMFSGLAQTGAWSCFDEFNRIEVEVLSVVAQQILTILNAVTQGVERFMFEGREISLDPTCGIFVTMNPGYAGRSELPENLKALLRPMSMMTPNIDLIIEIMLFAEGFVTAKGLSKKMTTLYYLMVQQLSKQDHYDFGLRSIKSVLNSAGALKRDPNIHDPEDVLLLRSIRDMNAPKFIVQDMPLFNALMSDLFPGAEPPIVDYGSLQIALETELQLAGLQLVPSIIKKCIQCYESKLTRHGNMLVGQSLGGKTTAWRILTKAMARLNKDGVLANDGSLFQPVRPLIINPKAVPSSNLYGEYDLQTFEWTDGVLAKVMREVCGDESLIEKWLLLDGPVDTLWIESMNTVLDDNKLLTLINGERIAMPPQVSLLFEVEDLSVASPATVSRAGMVYVDDSDMGWKPYVESWLMRVEDKSRETLKGLVDKCFPKMITIRENRCKEPVPTASVAVARNTCIMYDAFATAENGVNSADPEGYTRLIELWFLFSVMWSMGGTVDDDSRKLIDAAMRELDAQIPLKDSVFDYFVDFKAKKWAHWEEKLSSAWKPPPDAPFYKILVPTVDTTRYTYLLTAFMRAERHTLITGDVGVGKTSVVFNALYSLDESFVFSNLNFSAQTSSVRVSEGIESRVEKRTKDTFAPPGGKKLIVFIDDFNMPEKEIFGAQPPLEILRQWMQYEFWYDLKKQTQRFIKDVKLLAGMGHPGGGRTMISKRTLHKFHVLNMTFPDRSQLIRIFGTLINSHLAAFDDDIRPTGDMMTVATLEVYQKLSAELLPTPDKPHYIFNLRDISRVFQGVMLSQKPYFDTRDIVIRLWMHECHRVFADRLTNKPDREFFKELLSQKVVSVFQSSVKALFKDKGEAPFGDFMRTVEAGKTKPYEELGNPKALKTFIEEKLVDYNMEPGVQAMDLVMFGDAIGNVCRIKRVLSMPRSHAMLVGVGGSGRQSLSRLAAYIAGFKIFQIEVVKGYRSELFREDLKKLYDRAGVQGQDTLFIFNDTQVIESSFLEDINGILTSGEVSNLYPPDELAPIRESVRQEVRNAGLPENNDSMYSFFIEKVRSKMHLSLCMSPVGENYRNYVRMFPALVSCTTINWFSEWPPDALKEVATRFLESVELSKELLDPVSTIFAQTQTSVIAESASMLARLGRPNYVTPTNYLELVKGYCKVLGEKRKAVGDQAFKLKNGLQKLSDTAVQVGEMSVELEKKKKIVAIAQTETEELLVVIVQENHVVAEEQKKVNMEKEKIGKDEVETRKIADDAQADLDKAMPALEAATKALEGLNKKDISEVKAYAKPHKLVEKTLEAVMVLRRSEPSWTEAKKQMGDPGFLNQLINFDKDSLNDQVLQKVSKYTKEADFDPVVVGGISVACKSMCLWVRAMEVYGKIAKDVAPKRAKLQAAMKTLAKKQAQLADMEAKVKEIMDKAQVLKDKYDGGVAKKDALKSEAEQMEVLLARASNLVEGLGGERARWEISILSLDENLKNTVGDCLLAAAFLSYCGPFDSEYRQRLLEGNWLKGVKNLNIPCSADFNFCQYLANNEDVRDWNIQGLPADAFSTENGVLVTRGTRWPLMIDPQEQANKWVRNMEKANGLKLITLKQSDYLRTLENAIQFGQPVLMQEVLQELDPSLEPIMSRAVVKVGNRSIIKLGDKEVDYNPDFKFYLTTKLANPHYTPEISTKATIVNFCVKQQGLEDQLLGTVVRKERPELEMQKNDLVVAVAAGKRKLVELEDKILFMLANAEGSLLDNEELILTLQTSKTTSMDVTNQLQIAEQTEKKIDAAREGYRPSAYRASILYFLLSDLARVDPMYQFSLDAYVALFNTSLDKSARSDDLQERIKSLNEFHTYFVYRSTCRALFEAHKLLFSFQICAKILQGAGKMVMQEYDFFLRGGQVFDKSSQPTNPCSDWISETAWDHITELDKLPGFRNILGSFESSAREWREWYRHPEPETAAARLPGEWENRCSELQRTIIVRCLRPDRIIFATTAFIINNLGQKYTEPPVLDLNSVLADSQPDLPLIFVLSPGVDPTNQLSQLGEAKGIPFSSIALGQGQAPLAVKLIDAGIAEGHWVLLANCHLMESWLGELDKIIESLPTRKPNKEFRLWLSSAPKDSFPIGILQRAIKMTTEPPKGLKANMTRLVNNLSVEKFESCGKPAKYKKLLYAMCWFHAVLVDRRKFLHLGWNIPYDFNDSDFEVSELCLRLYLDEYDQTPWDALRYLIAEINYGGRVTDDMDRRLMNTYMAQFFCDDAIQTANFKLSSLSSYVIPEDGPLPMYKEVCAGLPAIDRPEAFGQHQNADLASAITSGNAMLEVITSLQPKVVDASGMSPEDMVYGLAGDLISAMPEPINIYQRLGEGDGTALHVVLVQELQRYNLLLGKIRSSLALVKKGIKGLVVMSPDLDVIYNKLLNGQVPPAWLATYPSLKPLASWARDLLLRWGQLMEWCEKGPPKVFWLAGFTYPNGFLTALMQTEARAVNVSIDSLMWDFPIVNLEEKDVTTPPKEGAYVRGLFLEGAGWNYDASNLCEPEPMELVYNMPMLHFKPIESKKSKAKGMYACPLYLYPLRTGSRERPSFMLYIDIKSGAVEPEVWIKRGTALLLATAE